MPRIEIGAGVVLAVLATFGVFGSIPVAAVLLAFGVLLVLYGGYEEWIKPRFRVEHRLTDWFLRRGWSVKLERRPQFNFLLRLSSASSKYEVFVTREKGGLDDMIGFTARVPVALELHEALSQFEQGEQRYLMSEILVYLTGKNMSFDLAETEDGIPWPPVVLIQTAIAQDHTLSQQSVDLTAKAVELSVIGVRHVIRKAVIRHVALRNAVGAPTPEPASDTAEPEPQ